MREPKQFGRDLSGSISLFEMTRYAASATGVSVPDGSPWFEDPIWTAYVLRMALIKRSKEWGELRSKVGDAARDCQLLEEALQAAVPKLNNLQIVKGDWRP